MINSNNENELLNSFFEEKIPLQTESRINFTDAQIVFRQLNIESLNDLVDRFDELDTKSQHVAVCIFRDYEYLESLPILFQGLFSNDSSLPGLCGGALALIGGEHIFNELLKLLLEYSKIILHYHVLYSLKSIHDLRKISALQLTEVLIDISQNGTSSEVVGDRDKYLANECRAMATEGLSNSLDYLDRRTKEYREGVKVLLDLLVDKSVEVRSNAAFSLGYLNEKRALEKLDLLVKNDFEICPGIGTVSSIAAESINWISLHHKM